jgi:hypothetical protein
MNIDFNEKELKAIEYISKMLDLPNEKVIIQALRTYQMVITGHAKLTKTYSDTCKLCKDLQENDKASNIDETRLEHETW